MMVRAPVPFVVGCAAPLVEDSRACAVGPAFAVTDISNSNVMNLHLKLKFVLSRVLERMCLIHILTLR